MTLYMIGLGLNDEKDISLKGLEAVKECDYVFLEGYTSRLNVSLERLENFYGRAIVLADREMVENNSDQIINKAAASNVAFLVVGDIFSATTHIDLFLRAKEKGIQIEMIHNASILTAVGSVGLELYKYGKTTSMPFFEPSFEPETPYDVIKMNLKNGLHTLVLLDIKPDRFMSVNHALAQLLEIENRRKEKVISEKTGVIGCARLGSRNQLIKYGSVHELLDFDFGGPLHCLIIPGKLHFMEEEMLRFWEINQSD
ncbi:TPA: diphthine synthase [Candidatus Woesearchaeota archaeon]|nr:hypothetical protein QT06_C0001G0237 [archaeon GW2011_AR15]MBS3103964.1 diphthine synthase [Candidatus Woesearchaeota archaeon]HIH40968.1 diphthine synthase [Candidatus Woesearchaeota archaeon]